MVGDTQFFGRSFDASPVSGRSCAPGEPRPGNPHGASKPPADRVIPASAWWLTCTLLACCLGVPFFLDQIPPVVDYPNHLARGLFLAFGATDPVLSQIYAANWVILPNLAVDLVLPPLLYIAPLHIAGRIVLGAALLLPLVGVLVYNRALFRQVTFWPCAAVLVAFNLAFLLGFMNFLFGVGAAFMTAAAWVRLRETAPRRAVFVTSAGAVVVFFCHLLGLSLLFALLTGYELDRLMTYRRWRPQQIGRRLLAAGAVFAFPLALYIGSPAAHATGPTEWMPVLGKLLFSLAPVMNYDAGMDIIIGGMLILAMTLGVRSGLLVMPRSTLIALALMLAAYLIAPFRMKGGAFFELRFIIIAGYLIFAGVRESRLVARRPGLALFGCLFVVFVAHTTLLADVWSGHDADIRGIGDAVQPVTPGSRVLIMSVDLADAPDYWRAAPPGRIIDGMTIANLHLPIIALMQRRAMTQSLFTDPAQQPVAVLPRFRNSSSLEAAWGPPSYTLLSPALQTTPALQAATIRVRYPYLTDWRKNFDFVLIMNPGGLSAPARLLPDQLELLRLTNVAALFRVRPPLRPADTNQLTVEPQH